MKQVEESDTKIIAKYEENMILKFTFKTFGYEFIRQAKLKILTAWMGLFDELEVQ